MLGVQVQGQHKDGDDDGRHHLQRHLGRMLRAAGGVEPWHFMAGSEAPQAFLFLPLPLLLTLPLKFCLR